MVHILLNTSADRHIISGEEDGGKCQIITVRYVLLEFLEQKQ